MSRFDICLPFVLRQECPHPDDWSNPANFSNDRHDPGGKTMCGIIQREYDHWRKIDGKPVRDVRLLSKEDGYAIYYEWYWEPHCDALPVGLDLQFFDSSVNMGTHEATVLLQRTLGLAAHGSFGPVTSAAVANLRAIEPAIHHFGMYRLGAYQRMKGWPFFHTGWTRREREITAQALEMARGASA